MALREINVEWKHIKSFATEANLRKRIEQDKAMYPEHDDRFIVVQTPEGRHRGARQIDWRLRALRALRCKGRGRMCRILRSGRSSHRRAPHCAYRVARSCGRPHGRSWRA